MFADLQRPINHLDISNVFLPKLCCNQDPIKLKNYVPAANMNSSLSDVTFTSKDLGRPLFESFSYIPWFNSNLCRTVNELALDAAENAMYALTSFGT